MTAIVIITAFIATILGSISGIGGGVIIKPVMDAICPFSASTISFLSGTTVLTMTIVSLLRSRGGEVGIDRRGTFLAIGGAVGGLVGKLIFSYVSSGASDPSFVSLVQNIVMVVLTVTVFFYVRYKAYIHTLSVTNPALSSFLGFLLGMLSSFLGIGGGPINIMLLSYFFSMDSKSAALNSLYIIFFSQAVSFISTAVEGFPPFEPLMLLPMMVAAVLGATIGRSVSRRLSGHGVDVLFQWMLVVITLISIYNCIRFA